MEEYRIHVKRGRFPSMTILEEQFSEGGVSKYFDNAHLWKAHPSRSGVNDVTDEHVVMVVEDFEGVRGWPRHERILAWGLERGLLPADEKEVYSFGINPETYDLQSRFTISGLGASVLDKRCPYVPSLARYGWRRLLTLKELRGDWHWSDRFLFVRK